jgi:hypothetical protein
VRGSRLATMQSRGDIQVGPVDRVHQRRVPAALFAQLLTTAQVGQFAGMRGPSAGSLAVVDAGVFGNRADGVVRVGP